MTGKLIERASGYAIIEATDGVYIVPDDDAQIKGDRLVWDEWHGYDALTTEQMLKEYEVMGFGYGFCACLRKKDAVLGSFNFIHAPRFYFNFKRK